MSIIIGYPGIGKSTLAGQHKFIDLESSCFKINGERISNWYIPYTNVALDLSSQGYKVFVSSHREVRDILCSCMSDSILTVVPSLQLKDAWIKKLHDRWIKTGLVKDKLALYAAETRYEEDIREIMNYPFACITLEDMNYDLKDILYNS